MRALARSCAIVANLRIHVAYEPAAACRLATSFLVARRLYVKLLLGNQE